MSLRLHEIRYRAGGQEILDGISLHARRGEVYGFLGHNGAGKTTALRIALGLLRPRSGGVEVDGFDALRFPREARARIGGLIEAPGFYREWNGPANLRTFARLRGLSFRSARREAERVFDRVGLGAERRKRFGHYSQGMRQRLGLAQALLGSPEYLLLDEPTNGLDPEAIADLRTLLRSLAVDEGRAVLLSSHLLSEVQELCHRVGILRRGVMLVEDEVETLANAVDARWMLRTPDAERASSVLRELVLPAEAHTAKSLVLDLRERSSEAVARALVERGVALQSWAPVPVSLESIYLRATHGELRHAPPHEPEVSAAAPKERRCDALGTLRAFRHELGRSAHPRHLLFVFALPIAYAVYIVWKRTQAPAEDAARHASAAFSTTSISGFDPFGRAWMSALPWLALVLALQASQAIAGDASRGTLRTLAQQPVARIELALGKLLGVLFAFSMGWCLLVGVAMAASAWWFDFKDVVEILPNGVEYPLRSASELWPEWRAVLFAPVFALLVHSLCGFLASALFRSAVAALVAALGAWLLLDFGWGFARESRIEAWWPTTYSSRLFEDVSAVRRFLDLAEGASTLSFHYAETALKAPLTWAVALAATALALFHRRSIP